MNWVTKKSKKIYLPLLEKGILIIVPTRKIVPDEITENSFVLGEWVLTFFHPLNNVFAPLPYRPDIGIGDQACLVLEKIFGNRDGFTHFINIKENNFDNEVDRVKAEKTNKPEQLWKHRESPIIFCSTKNVKDQNYHAEIFFPIVYSDPLNEAREFGSYIFPWSSSGSTNKFETPNIKKYVMTSDLGGTLTGYDQHEGEHLLIKHDHNFFQKQKIVEVYDDSGEESPYDRMLFSEFEKVTSLIVHLGESRDLLYHIPYYDYLLLGIKLYLQGRLTSDALEQFFEHIFIKKNLHIEKIKTIAERYKITLIIQSPFEPIFDNDSHPDTVSDFIRAIKNNFKELLSDSFSILGIEEESLLELKLVNYCLRKLTKSNADDNFFICQVWRDFLINQNLSDINNLKELCEIANVVMLRMASKGMGDHEVCSILPLADKKIQENFAKSIAHNKLSHGHIINFTMLLPIISFGIEKKTKEGVLFYNQKDKDTLLNIIDIDMLEKLSKNVRKFSEYNYVKTETEELSIHEGELESPNSCQKFYESPR